jgi:hypothetical protein
MVQNKSTKPGALTPAFVQAAARNPTGALSHMLLSAFGVTLSTLTTIASKLLDTKDMPIIILALTAAVQIRNHVVFVGGQFGEVRTKFPELIIEGDREQKDIFNFGALHALGHVLAHVTTNDLGIKILSKAGSCITGERLIDSEAGQINGEMHRNWSMEDKAMWPKWVTEASANYRAALDPIVAGVPGLAREFLASLAGATGAVPGPKVPAGRPAAP